MENYLKYGTKEYFENEIKLLELQKKFFAMGLAEAIKEKICEYDVIEDACRILIKMKDSIEYCKSELEKVQNG